MSDLKHIIGERLVCFECHGRVDLRNGVLVCRKCSRKYYIEHNLIVFEEPSFKAQYGQQFGEQAQDYEQIHGLDTEFSRNLALAIKHALERVTDLPAGCALEIGCGTGVLTRGCNYHGIAHYFLATDISREMLAEAAKKETAGNVLYVVQDTHRLNVKDAGFDIVIGTEILHHLLDIKEGLAEVYRVLRPNGAAVFMEPFYYGYQFLVVLMNATIEHLKLQQKYSVEHLRILEKIVQDFENSIQFRFKNRHSLENLAAFDDKAIFTHQDVEILAAEVGFNDVQITSPWQLNPALKAKVWKGAMIDTLEELRQAAALHDLKIDYSQIKYLDLVDDLIGHELLEHISPQGVIILSKPRHNLPRNLYRKITRYS